MQEVKQHLQKILVEDDENHDPDLMYEWPMPIEEDDCPVFGREGQLIAFAALYSQTAESDENSIRFMDTKLGPWFILDPFQFAQFTTFKTNLKKGGETYIIVDVVFRYFYENILGLYINADKILQVNGLSAYPVSFTTAHMYNEWMEKQ